MFQIKASFPQTPHFTAIALLTKILRSGMGPLWMLPIDQSSKNLLWEIGLWFFAAPDNFGLRGKGKKINGKGGLDFPRLWGKCFFFVDLG